jgi:hypothetical protein
MHEDDVRTILSDPDIMVASDAISRPTGRGRRACTPHMGRSLACWGPRSRVLTWEATIRTMTHCWQTASASPDGDESWKRMGDLVLFDADR